MATYDRVWNRATSKVDLLTPVGIPQLRRRSVITINFDSIISLRWISNAVVPVHGDDTPVPRSRLIPALARLVYRSVMN